MLATCSPIPGDRCRTDDDCLAGRACVAGTCRSSRPDADPRDVDQAAYDLGGVDGSASRGSGPADTEGRDSSGGPYDGPLGDHLDTALDPIPGDEPAQGRDAMDASVLDLRSVETGLLCHGLVDQAPIFYPLFRDGSPPEPLGGTIEDGLYYKTEGQLFNTSNPPGPSTLWQRQTMLIAGDTMHQVGEPDMAGLEWRQSRRIIRDALDQRKIVLTFICPDFSSYEVPPELDYRYVNVSYSFVGTGPGAVFTLIFPTMVEVFVRQ
jgi:hypothetical protein